MTGILIAVTDYYMYLIVYLNCAISIDSFTAIYEFFSFKISVVLIHAYLAIEIL